MKKYATLWLCTLALVVLGVCWSYCSGTGEVPMEKIPEHLIRIFNKRLPGTTFETDLENCIIKPDEGSSYRITFKNSTVTTDLVEILKLMNKNFPLEVKSYSAPNTAQIKEIKLLYNPKEKHLALLSLKDITVESKLSQHEGKQQIQNLGYVKLEKIHAAVEEIITPEMDISRLIRDEITDSDNKISNTSKKSNSVPPKSTIAQNIRIELNYILNGVDNFSVIMGVEKFRTNPGINNPVISSYLLSKDKNPHDLKQIIEKRMTISDVSTQLEKLKFSIKRSTLQWDIFFIDLIDFSSYLKPEETGDFLKMGNEIEIKNVRLVFPLKKEIEQLMNIKDLKIGFQIERITPEALKTFLDLSNTVIEWKAMAEHPGKQEDVFQKISLLTQFISSNPKIKLYISPFNHCFGTVTAEGTILSLSPPAGHLKLNIYKVDEIITKLTDTRLLPHNVMEEISQFLSQMTVKDENGNASMVLELKAEQTGIYYLNGKSILFNPTLFNSLKYFSQYR